MTPAPDDAGTTEISAGPYRLRAKVPDGIFSLAVEASEAEARAEHATFADRCMPLLARRSVLQSQQLRQELLRQLWEAREALTTAGLGYLGVLAGELEDRTLLLLLSIAAAPIELPDGIDPASLLAALLRHQYPDAEIEEFPTPHGQGAGIRRCGELSVPVAVPDSAPFRIDTGISQALVVFAGARLLGTVTGFCFSPDDIDLATIFTATVAYGLAVVP